MRTILAIGLLSLSVLAFGQKEDAPAPEVIGVPTVNDDCTGAVDVSALGTFGPYDTTGNTVAVDDPNTSCGSTTVPTQSNTTWFVYTASQAGQVTISTCASDYDTVVSAWTGACGALSDVGCVDDSCGLQSELTFDVTSGQTYYINIGDWGNPGGGNLFVDVTLLTGVPTLGQTGLIIFLALFAAVAITLSVRRRRSAV